MANACITHVPKSEAAFDAARRPWNPLSNQPEAVALSNYFGVEGDHIARMLDPNDPCSHEERIIHRHLEQKILGPGFPCVTARSAINRKTYRFGLYPTLGSRASAMAICHDIYGPDRLLA